MDIPLEKRMKKRLHVDIGRLQDEVMEAAYALDNGLVFRGGTAIWRCFSGNRFSEDLDLYCSRADRIANELENTLAVRALLLSKFRRTENLIFAKVSDGQAEVRLELNISTKKRGEATRYEKMNGNRMEVLCLSCQELVLEKIAAYKNRRFVRDLYDICYLSDALEPDAAVKKAIDRLLSNFSAPVDEANLQTFVYSGIAPTTSQMLVALRRRFS